MGNDQSRAEASVTCWIGIDGEPVVVSSDYMDTGLDKQEASEVVFDKRPPPDGDGELR
jgi:type I site-specific restriction endonuclease